MGKADAFDQAFKTLYEKLDVKEYKPKYGSKRPKMSKKFRRDLNRIIGHHAWASADKWRREIIDEARRLRRLLRQVMGWMFFQELRRESIARRIFKAIPVKYHKMSTGVAS
jgi:hypothetical protein